MYYQGSTCRSHPKGWETSVRLRIQFSKIGKVRFVGHRDVARIVERALRRCGTPVTYSQGFSPRMRLSFGLALPTCYESEAEYLDVPLDPEHVVDDGVMCVGWGRGKSCSTEQLRTTLNETLPEGFEVTALVIEPKGGPSLQESVTSCTWRFDIRGATLNSVEQAIAVALESATIDVERTKKNEILRENIRDGVRELRIDGISELGPIVVTELSAKPRVIRPSELLQVIAPGSELGIAKRTHQWIEREGKRNEPLMPTNSQKLKDLA